VTTLRISTQNRQYEKSLTEMTEDEQVNTLSRKAWMTLTSLDRVMTLAGTSR